MRDSDGKDVTLEVSAIAIDQDEYPRVLWLGRDVTARKELEGHLLQADRLAVLGTLAAGMAHAINNPLSYTLLNLEHVARRMRHLSTDRDYYAEARVRLAEAHDGAERVARIVRQMRTLSRSRPSPPGPVDVRAVLESVLSMVGNEIRHRGQLSLRMDAVPNVFATESELEQAFLGLLVYVARSLPEEVGGSREIRLTTETDDAGNAVVIVSDDGPVLGDDTRSHLFDPFAGGEALGLGLAMCQSILASIDGRIEITIGQKRGTTFRVVLRPAPAAPAEKPRHPSSTRPLPPPAVPARPARVLVIDDDPGVASALRAMLEAHHEVKSVDSAREGLQILLSDEEFDIVFCDLIMPDLSGIDVYCALELNRPERVEELVFMTGGVFTPDAERFLSQIPNPRIEKPFSLNCVEDLLARAVAKHAEAARPEPET
jgi:nitrogen-specific signal transduction histidine kinase